MSGGDAQANESILSVVNFNLILKSGGTKMPDVKEVSAKSPKMERETLAVVNYGSTIEESIEMFGADAVNSNAFANWRVTLQAAIRRGHLAGKSDEEIQNELANAKMGVAVSGGSVDPIQASLAKFKLMDADEQADYLEQLRQAAG